jgi:phosphatidylserine decarboxylase
MHYFLISEAIFWLIVLIFAVFFVFFYRYYFFLRDPKRKIPEGNNMVSPADGYILYIKELNGEEIPFSVKKGQKIVLKELLETKKEYNLLIGIFMTPLSVHYNRFPFAGKVTDIYYKEKPSNRGMTQAFLNVFFDMKPYTEGADYILENERNVTLLENDNIECAIVQIADKWVRKIENTCKIGDEVQKGEKLGVIKMGSQCDIFLKIKGNYKLSIKERDYVRAGSSVIIEFEN